MAHFHRLKNHRATAPSASFPHLLVHFSRELQFHQSIRREFLDILRKSPINQFHDIVNQTL